MIVYQEPRCIVVAALCADFELKCVAIAPTCYQSGYQPLTYLISMEYGYDRFGITSVTHYWFLEVSSFFASEIWFSRNFSANYRKSLVWPICVYRYFVFFISEILIIFRQHNISK